MMSMNVFKQVLYWAQEMCYFEPMNKSLSFILLFLFGASTAFSQSAGGTTLPAPTNVLTREQAIMNSNSYELQQNNEALSKQLKINTQQGDQWLNLYLSKRFTAYGEKGRNLNTNEEAELATIINQMKAALGESYEYQYASYLQLNKKDEGLAYLERAYSLNPTNPEIWDDKLFKAVIEENEADQRGFANALVEVGYYSGALMEYNSNVLNSVAQNAVLITYGQLDTYPLMVMQKGYNYRPDVKIICIEWLNSEKYKSQLSKKLGVSVQHWSSQTPVKTIIADLKQPVYVGLTVPPTQLKEIKSQLYCTGLAFLYSMSNINNLESLHYNWINLFAKNFVTNSEPINANYTMALVQLSAYYGQTGNNQRKLEVDQYLKEIGRIHQLEKLIKKHID